MGVRVSWDLDEAAHYLSGEHTCQYNLQHPSSSFLLCSRPSGDRNHEGGEKVAPWLRGLKRKTAHQVYQSFKRTYSALCSLIK